VIDFRGSFEAFDLNFETNALYTFSTEALLGVNETLFSYISDKNTSEGKIVEYVLFCPDEFVKEDSSGDIGYGLPIRPERKIDDWVVNYKTNVQFLDYLRLCFHWACLPNLNFIPDNQIPKELQRVLQIVRAEIKEF
jgi:hypothetical protein